MRVERPGKILKIRFCNPSELTLVVMRTVTMGMWWKLPEQRQRDHYLPLSSTWEDEACMKLMGFRGFSDGRKILF